MSGGTVGKEHCAQKTRIQRGFATGQLRRGEQHTRGRKLAASGGGGREQRRMTRGTVRPFGGSFNQLQEAQTPETDGVAGCLQLGQDGRGARGEHVVEREMRSVEERVRRVGVRVRGDLDEATVDGRGLKRRADFIALHYCHRMTGAR